MQKTHLVLIFINNMELEAVDIGSLKVPDSGTL
jgi:hypothetical protein